MALFAGLVLLVALLDVSSRAEIITWPLLRRPWLSGPTSRATSVRGRIAPNFREPRVAYGGLAFLLMLLFWWDPVVATHRLVPSLLLIALAVLGTEVLRRQVIRESRVRTTAGSPAGAA